MDIPLRENGCVRCGRPFDPAHWYTFTRKNGRVNYRCYCPQCMSVKRLASYHERRLRRLRALANNANELARKTS